MKQGGTILNVILLIAVAILFYLHFSSTKQGVEVPVTSTDNTTVLLEDSLTKYMNLDSNITARPIKIAYVNNDSLNKNLNMLRDVEDLIAAKEEQIKQRILNKKKDIESRYERKVNEFKKKKSQYDLNLPNYTDAQLGSKQKELKNLEMEIMQMQQTVEQDLYAYQQQQEQQYMILKGTEMEKYYLKVQRFCKSFAKTLGFDFILINQNGGTMLYSNEEYDISNYVVDAINREYDLTKKSNKEVK